MADGVLGSGASASPAVVGLGVLAQVSWPIVSRLPLVGDLAVSPHGLLVAVGVVVGAAMLVRRATREVAAGGNLLGATDVPDVGDAVRGLLGAVLVGAIVGARAFHVLAHLDVYAADPARVLAVQEGGLTFLGGVAGGVAAGWWVARRRGWDALRLLDHAAPGLAIGLAVGRLGDLAIGDHLGSPTTGWWGWRCTGDWNPVGGPNAIGMTAPVPYPRLAVESGAIPAPTVGCFDEPVLQTAMVDLLVALAVGGLLLVLERRTDTRGLLAGTWVVAYGVLRLVADVARLDRRAAGLTGTQWALAAAVVAVLVVAVRHRRGGVG